MKEFDRKAIEALEVKTVEEIEAITWPLNVGDELKAFDEQNDLIYLRKESDKLIYAHTSNRKEWQAGVVHFELPLEVNNEPASEPAEEVTE